MNNLIAFGYYGGKYSHLDWLLPLLPTDGITHYCEPFGGSAAVLLNRKLAKVETYNDLDGEVVNFFKVLREHKDALIEQLTLTPFSRLELALACERRPGLSELERARQFYVRARQAFAATPTPSAGQWSYCVTDNTAALRWLNGVPKLAEIADRLRSVQIENLPALEVLTRYDRPETLFYVDPPYVLGSRTSAHEYVHELTDDEHHKLAAALKQCKGKVALSGYDCGMYRELYKDWHLAAAVDCISWASPDRSARREMLWTNYDPAEINKASKQLSLFDAVNQ